MWGVSLEMPLTWCFGLTCGRCWLIVGVSGSRTGQLMLVLLLAVPPRLMIS